MANVSAQAQKFATAATAHGKSRGFAGMQEFRILRSTTAEVV